MKEFLIILVLTSASIIGVGQKTALEKASDSSCRCLLAAKDKIKSPADFDKYGQGCIIKAALPFFGEISKEENIPLEDLNRDAGHQLGQKIGMKLIADCPVFLELVALYANNDSEVVTGKTTGVVTTVELTDHVYLNIKEQSGKIIKVAWVEYFPGADDYKTNPASMRGKTVEVEWKQSEIYNMAQKDFTTMKQISKLKIKE